MPGQESKLPGMTTKPRKRTRKTYPKIKLGSTTREEFIAAYKLTPAELRSAETIVRKVIDDYRRTEAKKRGRSSKARSAAR